MPQCVCCESIRGERFIVWKIRWKFFFLVVVYLETELFNITNVIICGVLKVHVRSLQFPSLGENIVEKLL